MKPIAEHPERKWLGGSMFDIIVLIISVSSVKCNQQMQTMYLRVIPLISRLIIETLNAVNEYRSYST
jgi:hypothetical protein